MIDISDYKLVYQQKIKHISHIWFVVLFLITIGIIYLNNSFKYYSYYSTKGEYKDDYLYLYALVDDIEKITDNREIFIERKKFAYKVSSISSDNLYLNNNYYKEIKLSIDDDLIDNTVVDVRIISDEYHLLEYVFKTVWR